jgi:hypothetical protein
MIDTVILGQYRADFDDEISSLTLYDEKTLMKLSPDETYRLLIWLNDNYRDKLHMLTQQGDKDRQA